MSAKLTWRRLATGDQLCDQYPIMLAKPTDRRDGNGWHVRVPLDRDSTFDDGWQWTQALVAATRTGQSTYEEPALSSLREAQAYVREHLDIILGLYGSPWRDYDGDPVAAAQASQDRHEEWLTASGQSRVRQAPAIEAALTAEEESLAARLRQLTADRRRLVLAASRGAAGR